MSRQSIIFSSPQRPDWLWGPSSFLSNEYRRLLTWGEGGKAAGTWNWPLTSILSSWRGA